MQIAQNMTMQKQHKYPIEDKLLIEDKDKYEVDEESFNVN